MGGRKLPRTLYSILYNSLLYTVTAYCLPREETREPPVPHSLRLIIAYCILMPKGGNRKLTPAHGQVFGASTPREHQGVWCWHPGLKPGCLVLVLRAMPRVLDAGATACL